MTQVFADELTHFAETVGCPHLNTIIDRLRRPVQIAVVARRGVGRGAVTTALRRRGVTVVSDGVGGAAADVTILVVAEAVKPEDLRLLPAVDRPSLIVLTKADLAGSGPGGPMAVARRRAKAIAVATGTPTVPLIGVLAALDLADPLDDDAVAALRSFVAQPADLASVDAFVDGPHAVGHEVRARLVERLDRFGIAHGVLALADGCDPGELTARLQHLGNLDEVMSAVEVTAPTARYLRVCTAIAELRCLAIRLADDQMATLPSARAAVMAAMTAAVEVMESAGLAVDRGDAAACHVRRAVHWRRYGRGPVNGLHRRCSADIVTGSLRLLAEQSS